MKQLTCEMCGSTELIKQDGFFVCQTCGTKYSVEEAKKMMIEGTVHVKGEVKIDESDKVTRYMLVALNAVKANNNKEAEDYCNKVIELDPKHSLAWFYKGISAVWQSTLSNIRIHEFFSCVKNALMFSKSEEEFYNILKDACETYTGVSLAIVDMALKNTIRHPDSWANDSKYFKIVNELRLCISWLEFKIKIPSIKLQKGFKNDEDVRANIDLSIKNYKKQIETKINNAAIEIWNSAYREYTKEKYPNEYQFEDMKKNGIVPILMLRDIIPKDTEITDDNKKSTIQRCENLIFMCETMRDVKAHTARYTSYGGKDYPVTTRLAPSAQQVYIDYIKSCHKTIKYCKPDYTIPFVADAVDADGNEVKATNGGCYVATCVYGSYDCPEVWTLRRFRDNTLGSTWYGRLFIHTYYAISPTLVKWFGKTKWFKKMWKGTLDRMVNNLNSKGVEDTPYDDIEW